MRIRTLFSVIVALLVPPVLVLLGVRLLLTPVFPQLEYRMPGFPVDPYGFSLEDRLRWSRPSIEYLLNDADISFLAELSFADGQPIYNERELTHMEDVKQVVQVVLPVFRVLLVLLVLLGLWAWARGWRQEYLRGLRWGGRAIVVLIAVLGIFAALSFWQFFTLFHALFFEGDSWLFYYSDTLIRLFPLRFWQDVFIYILGLALGLGIVLGWLLKAPAARTT